MTKRKGATQLVDETFKKVQDIVKPIVGKEDITVEGLSVSLNRGLLGDQDAHVTVKQGDDIILEYKPGYAVLDLRPLQDKVAELVRSRPHRIIPAVNIDAKDKMRWAVVDADNNPAGPIHESLEDADKWAKGWNINVIKKK